jgi:hypothetical protein
MCIYIYVYIYMYVCIYIYVYIYCPLQFLYILDGQELVHPLENISTLLNSLDWPWTDPIMFTYIGLPNEFYPRILPQL